MTFENVMAKYFVVRPSDRNVGDNTPRLCITDWPVVDSLKARSPHVNMCFLAMKSCFQIEVIIRGIEYMHEVIARFIRPLLG
jgi:hypothetical protein